MEKIDKNILEECIHSLETIKRRIENIENADLKRPADYINEAVACIERILDEK